MSLASRQFALFCAVDNFSPYSPSVVAPGLSFFKISITVPKDSEDYRAYSYETGYNFGSFQGQPHLVDENDISLGDWVGTGDGEGIAYQIVEIITTDDSVQYVVADIDGYCLIVLGGSRNPRAGGACIFRVNEDSIPMFSSPSAKKFLESPELLLSPVQWVSDMMSRFASRNSKTQYVTVYQPLGKNGPQGKDFVVGESVYIDSNGVFQRSAGSLYISDTVGIVTSTGIPYEDWFSFRPSGKYFDNTYKTVIPEGFFPNPTIIEQVGGQDVILTPGKKLYINPISGGRQYTTVICYMDYVGTRNRSTK